MKSKYGGGGDFAYAYVVAHEIGHHVQDLLGILDKVDNYKQQVSQTQANALSVRVELQADCLAGVWADHANQKWQILEQGDIEKALATAQAIGDDRLQTAARGYAVPDSFTHGSSAQRAEMADDGAEERRHQFVRHVLELSVSPETPRQDAANGSIRATAPLRSPPGPWKLARFSPGEALLTDPRRSLMCLFMICSSPGYGTCP